MAFAGQRVLDAFILACAILFIFVTIAYVAMLWSMRGNFFIMLRSPLLTCMLGLFIVVRYTAKTYEYVVTWQGDDVEEYGVAALVGGASLLAAEIAIAMIAVRLLVMYQPSKRARWGRYVKEKGLACALGFAWVLMEMAAWSAAWFLGISSTGSTVETLLRPLSLFITLVASAWLVCRLRHVHDSTNLSRDIGLVGRSLVITLSIFTVLQVFTLPSAASKYAQFVLLTAAKAPVVYLIIIRPVREVLSHIPSYRRTGFQKLLAPRLKRTPITATDDSGERRFATSQGRSRCADENRLATIMSFFTLRTAFGEFCRKSLCSEGAQSFEFLVDVAELKAFDDRSAGGGNGGEKIRDFARFLDIVNDYIKHDAHSEINIGADIKREIMGFIKFETYASLDPDGRREIFDPAQVEITKLLRENLLGKFLVSDEYKAVVDLGEGG